MVQLLAPYIDHESHNAQRYRQTERDGQTDRRHAYANTSRSHCVAVRSAKNVSVTSQHATRHGLHSERKKFLRESFQDIKGATCIQMLKRYITVSLFKHIQH